MARSKRTGGNRSGKKKTRSRSGIVGILNGIVWGLAVVAVGFVALNEFAPPVPEAPAPDASAAVAPPQDAVPTIVEDTAAVVETANPGIQITGRATAAANPDESTANPEARTANAEATAATPEASTANLAIAAADATPAPAAPDAKPGAATALLGPAIPISGPAVKVNARSFQDRDGTGLLSVVLYTSGSATIPENALSAMSMPLTLAIDPARPGDLRVARVAPSMGHEILATLPLHVADDAAPQGLSVGDGSDRLELGTAETLVKLNMAIGATPPDGAEILGDPEGMAALLKPVAAHSFVWVEPRPSARSAAALLAAQSGLIFIQANVFVAPGAAADRVLQGLGEAAEQARASGSAVIFVEASEEALRAVVQWGFAKRGNDVVFAPISAIVRKRGQG